MTTDRNQALAVAVECGLPLDTLIQRNLPSFVEATQLEIAETAPDGREHLLTPAAADAWRRLKAAATADGIDLFIASAFRSVERQAEIIRRKLERGLSVEDILAVSAPPGFSEHHTGRAIDMSTPGVTPLEVEFEQTDAYAWLLQHAGEFGFVLSYPEGNACGFQYEPWHWCYADAVDVA